MSPQYTYRALNVLCVQWGAIGNDMKSEPRLKKTLLSLELTCRWALLSILGFPGGSVVKNTPANEGEAGDMRSIPGLGKIPWRREKQPTLVFLPGEGNSGNKQLLKLQPWNRCCDSSKKAATLSMDFCFTTRLLVDSLRLVKSLRINKTGWPRQILSLSSHLELAYFLGGLCSFALKENKFF